MNEPLSIWHTRPDISALNALHDNTAVAHLGIRITVVGDDFLTGTMPVDARTVQPAQLLHGGASVLFAETLGSAAANHCVDMAVSMCVGLEINANHVRGVRSGMVTGTARAVHLGRRSQIWEIRIVDERDALVCIARLTSTVVDRAT